MQHSTDTTHQLMEEASTLSTKYAAIQKELKKCQKELKRKQFVIRRLQVDEQITKRFLNVTIQDLEHKNQELEKYIESNLQLENFAHIASHDLKAPLNNILSFSQLLKKTSTGRLTPPEVQFVDFIVKAAFNMQATINALFQFSRASNSKLKITTFSPTQLLQELKADISKVLSESNAILLIESLPSEMTGDAILIREVFQNLILNGVKFVPKETQPTICIKSQENDLEWLFSVTDNGIGIAEEFKEKIFIMLQRLNTKKEYEGSGMGLAICKKIVTQHGGRIWVESVLNEGSTFHFSIAKACLLNNSAVP